MTSTKKNFHIPLADETYGELRELAERTERPATQIAREAIEYWLRIQRRNLLHSQIQQYAVAEAGGPEDLDAALEAAGIENLLSEKDKKG